TVMLFGLSIAQRSIAAQPRGDNVCAGSTSAGADRQLSGLTVDSGRSCTDSRSDQSGPTQRMRRIDCGPRVLHPSVTAYGVCGIVRYVCTLGAWQMTAKQRRAETTIGTLSRTG